MNILSYIKKIAVLIEDKNDNVFIFTSKQQLAFLDTFNDPVDDIERSYYQYLCQMKFKKSLVKILINFCSLPLLMYFYFRKSDIVNKESNQNAVFFADEKPNSIIPETLFKEYKCICRIEKKKMLFTSHDKKFFLEVCKRYPFSWLFLLKCLIKIKFYSYEIASKNPEAIIACNEYSFTSSLLTCYCEKNNIVHINIMHGEKLLYMRDSFFRFHKCYVWNSYYIDLFKILKAESSQFLISVPESMHFNRKNVSKIIDFTYYLGAEQEDTLHNIYTNLLFLETQGYKIAIRPHPRYSKINEINVLFSNSKIEIERIDRIPIDLSILRTRNAISLYSTVLNQAYHNGTKIVIDDISNRQMYYKIKDLKYLMLSVEHTLLSNLINTHIIA